MSEICHVEAIRKTASEEERQDGTTVLLTVRGMGCENCANRVRNSLLSVHGVVAVDIALEVGTAKVVFNPRLADVAELTGAVARAGGDGRHEYTARLLS